MGNVHYIRQEQPFKAEGAAIPILPSKHQYFVEKWREEELDEVSEFYTELVEVDIQFPMPVFLHAGVSGEFEGTVAFMIVKDGGKMWCGFDRFIAHLRAFAPFLDDSVFVVKDEMRMHHARITIEDHEVRVSKLSKASDDA